MLTECWLDMDTQMEWSQRKCQQSHLLFSAMTRCPLWERPFLFLCELNETNVRLCKIRVHLSMPVPCDQHYFGNKSEGRRIFIYRHWFLKKVSILWIVKVQVSPNMDVLSQEQFFLIHLEKKSTLPSSRFQTASTLKMKALKVAAKKPLQ